MSKKQDLERVELQMAKFTPIHEEYMRIEAELKAERALKLYSALSEFVSDAQLDQCKKADIADIVRAHMNGQPHKLDSVTVEEAERRAAFEIQLKEAGRQASGTPKRRKKKSAAVVAANNAPAEAAAKEPQADEVKQETNGIPAEACVEAAAEVHGETVTVAAEAVGLSGGETANEAENKLGTDEGVSE